MQFAAGLQSAHREPEGGAVRLLVKRGTAEATDATHQEQLHKNTQFFIVRRVLQLRIQLGSLCVPLSARLP